MSKWTKETALPVIREAFREVKLSAQNGARSCNYRSDAGPCVIGLLVPDELAESWDRLAGGTSQNLKALLGEHQAARDLFGENFVDNYDYDPKKEYPDDARWFVELQRAHDRWINARGGNSIMTEEQGEQKFKEFIGV